MRQVSFYPRVIAFYAIIVVCAVAMMCTANPSYDGLWQFMQLVGCVACVFGISQFDTNRRIASLAVIIGMLIAFAGGLVTVCVYMLLTVGLLILSNNALWEHFKSVEE